MDEARLTSVIEFLDNIIQTEWPFIHIMPGPEEVIIPEHFKDKPFLVLQIGVDMPRPIHDLHWDREKITATLTFAGQPYPCSIPWSSVVCITAGRYLSVLRPEIMPEMEQYCITQAAGAATETNKTTKKKKVDAPFLRVVK